MLRRLQRAALTGLVSLTVTVLERRLRTALKRQSSAARIDPPTTPEGGTT